MNLAHANRNRTRRPDGLAPFTRRVRGLVCATLGVTASVVAAPVSANAAGSPTASTEPGQRPAERALIVSLVAVSQAHADQFARHEARLEQSFSQATGRTIDMQLSADTPSLVDAIAAGRVEMALVPVVGLGLANRLCGCVKPLVAPVATDGATGIRSLLLADPAKVPDLTQLSRFPVALGGPDDLGRSGIALALFDDADALETVRIASGEALVEGATAGAFGAYFAWQPTEYGEAAQASALRDAVDTATGTSWLQLWASDEIAFGPWIVSNDLEDGLTQRLKDHMLGLYDQEPILFDILSPLHGGGFRPVSAATYKHAGALTEAMRAR